MLKHAAALSRIVGVEEHIGLPELVKRISVKTAKERGFLSRDEPFGTASMTNALADTEGRIEKLDEAGITVQVLSLGGPGADLLPPHQAIEWARDANDAIARRVAQHPDRYAALAHLPLTDPDASADELERAVRDLGFKGTLVNGATGGRYLDHPAFEPLLLRAAMLDVPIYVHPAPSPRMAREALYGGLPDDFSFWMSVSGWGWHADTAVHVLRLLLSGAFTRHPNLKIIIGHLGEGLQIMMPRLDQQFHQFAGFRGVPSEILRQHLWVSFGGFYSASSFQAALDAFGPERLLFSVDYPFGSLQHGRAFLESLPVDDVMLTQIAHGNADALLKLRS